MDTFAKDTLTFSDSECHAACTTLVTTPKFVFVFVDSLFKMFYLITASESRTIFIRWKYALEAIINIIIYLQVYD